MAMRIRMGWLGRVLAVAALLGGVAAGLTGCDEDPTSAAIYSELYGWEDYGYGGWDDSSGWDDSGWDESGYSASDAVETHLGNFVDYGDGVSWSTNDYGW